MENDLDKLYKALISKGYSKEDIGSSETFRAKMSDKGNRRELYDYVSSRGDFRIGDYDTYEKRLSAGKPGSVAQQVIDEYDASMRNAGVQPRQTQQSVQTQPVQPQPMYDGSQFEPALQVPDWTTQHQKAIENIATSGTATPATDEAGHPVYPVKPQEVAYDEAVQELLENMPQPLNVQLKSLQDDVSVLRDENKKKLKRYAGSGSNAMSALMGSSQYMQASKEDRQEAGALDAAERLLNESQDIVDESEQSGKTNFVSGLLRGVRDNAFDPEQWTFGLADMADSAYLLRAVQKAEKGEQLTPAEEKLLDASVMNMAVNAYYGDMLGRGYKAGQVTAQSLPFMLEFAVNPVSSSGSVIAKNLLKYGMKKFGGKAVNRVVPRIAARLAGDTAAAAAMTGTTGAARVAADAMDRLAGNYEYGRGEDGQMQVEKSGDMSVGEAIARGFGTTLLENQSEMIFNAFKAGGKLAREAAGRSVSMFGGLADNELVKAVKRLRNAPMARELRQRTQIGGVFEEYGEEVYNNLASVATGDMSAEDALSVDTNIDTFLGLVPTQLAFSAIGLGGLVWENASARKRLRDFTGRLSEDERELFDELHEAIRGGGTDIPRDFIKATLADDRLSDEQKKERVFAVKDMLTEKKSEDLQTEAEAQEQEEPAMSSEEIQAGKVDTYRRWVRAQRRVSSFGIPQESLDGMTLTQLADNYDLDDKQVQAVAEYKDAQQQFGQYEADFNARLEAERQRAEQQARADVDRLGNKKTGMVTQAIRKGADKPVYITGGTLALNDDGTIDHANSSTEVYYLDEDGNKQMAVPEEFEAVISNVPDETVIEQQAHDAETAFKQAEQASLQSPDIPAPEKGVTFNLNGANYVIERPTPDGGLLAYKLDESGEIDTANGNVIELSAEEYYKAKESELWGTPSEIVDDLSENKPEYESVQEAGDSNVTEQTAEPTAQPSEAPAAQGGANDVLSSEQQLADLVATLPKKKTGELDYRSMTPQQQYDYTRLTESPEVAAEDLKADVEDKRAEIEKMKQQLAKATGGQRAELRDKVRGADKELAELEDFFRSVAPAREQAETPDLQPADLSGDEEYMDWVAENSEDPAETAAAYRSAKEAASHENNLRPWQQQLLGMKINTSSFNRFGDRNQVTGALAKGWLRKDGRQLDTLAQELSLLGEEVTEQDIVDFMLQNPSNHVSQRSEIMRKLAARFSEIASAEMGFPVGGPDSNTGRLYLILKEANQKLADLSEQQKQEVRQAIDDDMLDNDRQAQAVEEFITEDYAAAYDEAMRQTDEEEADARLASQIEEQGEPLYEGMTADELDEIYSSLTYTNYGTERQTADSTENPAEPLQERTGESETSDDGEDIPAVDREDGEADSGTEQSETGTEALTSEGNYVPLQRNQTEEDNERTEVESLSGESGGLDGENETEAYLRRAGDRTAASDGRSRWTKESLLRDVVQRNKGNQTWIEDIQSITGKHLLRGGENDVYLSRDGNYAIKVNDFSYLPDNSTNFDSFMNRVDAHNELFPNDAITILGFTLNSDGNVSVVLSQPYISNAREATQEEIENFLEDMDFYTDMSGNWTDGIYEIADTKPNNVLVDEDGNLHFIDVLPYDTRKPGKMLEIPRNRDAFQAPAIERGENIFDYAERVAKAKETDDMRRSVDTNPTEAQKEAGNYKKGHVKLDGYNITIENPKGSTRSGRDAQGNEWSVTMQNDYGYIRGTKAVDGDHIDVFLSDTPEQGNVYVIDQIDQQTGEFDESKVMYGFNSMEEARDAYLSNYSTGWKVGPITEVSKDEFKKWIDSSTEKRKAFSEYKSVKAIEGENEGQTEEEIKPVGTGPFGNIYNQFKGKAKEAVKFLLGKKEGEAVGALHHKDIGDISLVWGNSKAGLEKIARKHPEVLGDLQGILDNMEIVSQSENRIKLESDTHFAVVSREFLGTPREQWLLTAYEKKETPKPTNSRMDVDSDPLGKSDDTATRQDLGVSSANKDSNSSETMQISEKEPAKAGQPHTLPGRLLKAYESGDEILITSMEKEMRDYINGSDNMRSVYVTFLRSKDLERQMEKGSPSNKTQHFISEACKDVLKKAGLPAKAMQSERARTEATGSMTDPRMLDIMSADPSFDVLQAVVRNPNTGTATLENIAKKTNYSYLADDARQILDERKGEDDGIRFREVYHGSPADFDRFDHNFMGSGEGAQAYGWGTYVTEVNGIARSYAENLTGRDYTKQINRLAQHIEAQKEFIKTRKADIRKNEDYEKYAKSIRKNLRDSQKEYKSAERAGNEKDMEFYQSLINISNQQLEPEHHKHLIDSFWDDINNAQADIDKSNAEMSDLKNKLKDLKGKRNLYTVEIPEDTGENYLDWEQPISDNQAKMIEDAAKQEFDDEMVDKIMRPVVKSNEFKRVYAILSDKSRLVSDKAVSEFLSRAGFTGIKYPAEATAGGRADGARNYVIFNEKDLEITDHLRFRERLNEVNERFNEELSRYQEGKMGTNDMFHLGNPNGVMRMFLPDLPIVMRPRIMNKASNTKHNVDVSALEDLPARIAAPIFVFRRNDNALGILTEIKDRDGLNVCVAIELNKSIQNGGEFLVVNDIRSIHGRDASNLIKPIVYNSTLAYVDKEKALEWFSSASSNYQQEITNQELSDATKIVENFENPTLSSEKLREGSEESVHSWLKGMLGTPSKTQKERKAFAERERKRMVNWAHKVVEKLHLDNVEIVTETSALEGRKARAKGFFDPKTGKIVIVVPNHRNTFDIEQTILHEAVAHYGLRNLFEDNFDTFLDNVFANAEPDVKERIIRLMGKHGWNARVATEEYLASLAEETNFENVNAGWWQKIKSLFIDMLHKIGLDGFSGVTLSDNELRYILWRSYENLAHPGHYRNVFETATDVAMQYELKVGNYAEPATVGSVAASESVQGLKAERIEKLRNSKPVEITGEEYKGKYELNRDSAKQWIKDNLRGEYTNKDTGEKIEIRKDGAQKVTSHSMGSEAHLKSLVAIPQMIENSIFIEERPNEKDNYKYDRYRYYVCGLKIGDVDYTAKITVGVKGASKYYDHSLTKIEKGTLIDNIDALSTTFDNNQNALVSGIKDTKLLSILQENGEKDAGILYRENGEVDTDGTIQAYEDALRTWKFKAREAYQDSMLALKELQNVVERNSGEKLKSFENAYMAENQMSSKSTREAEVYGNKFFKPMLKAVSDLMDNGLTYDVVKRYVMAKHGLERNEVFARRDAVQTSEEEYRPLYKEAEKKYKEGELSEEQYKERLSELDQLRQAKEDAEYNKNRERDYSGLSSLMQGEEDYETAASEFVEEFEKDNDVAELWNAINDATGQTLKKSYESGMMSKKTYDRIKSQFKYYVPLRGWNEETAEDVYEYLASETSPVNSVLKTAKGRTSIADDPFAVIGNMAESTILQGNRNLMKQNFLNMAINHPSELLTVGNVWYVQDPSTGEWTISMPDIQEGDRAEEVSYKIEEHNKRMKELAKEGMAQKKKGSLNINYRIGRRQSMEHAVIVKQNGEDYVIYVNGNPRAAQAVNGMTNPDVEGNKVFESISRFNRWMAANFTTRNPAFVLSNLSRDLIFSMSAVAVKEDSAYAKAFAKNIPSTMKAIAKGLNGKDAKTETDRYFQEFLDNGGETGYTALHNIDEYKRMIGKELKRMSGKTDYLKAVRTAGEWFGNMNRWAEDVARFNAYRTSRQMGRSITDAVNDAKEITVNFNKKGSGYKTGGLFGFTAGVSRNLYLFFNAAVQSLNNFSKLARKNRSGFLTLLGGFASAGFLVPLLNEILMSAAGDDEDYYANLPEWTRRNNLCLYIGGGRFLTVPLPIELRAFYGLGEMAYQATSGKDKYASENVAYAAINQITELLPINPLGNNGDLVTTYMPDALKPFWSIHTNKDFTGKPIYRKNAFNEKMPEHTKAYKSTADWLVGLSEWTNELAGGNKYRRAKYLEPVANWNPAKVEYLFESYFGGMATTVNQTGKTLAGLVKTSIDGNFTENVQTRSVPVLNRFLNNASDDRSRFANINNLYYSYYDLYEDVAKDYRGYNNEVARGNFEYLEELKNLIESDEFKVYQIFKSGKAQIDKINKAEKSLPEASEKERKELEKMAADLKQNVVDRIQDELNKR